MIIKYDKMVQLKWAIVYNFQQDSYFWYFRLPSYVIFLTEIITNEKLLKLKKIYSLNAKSAANPCNANPSLLPARIYRISSDGWN